MSVDIVNSINLEYKPLLKLIYKTILWFPEGPFELFGCYAGNQSSVLVVVH
jgi:hypothetical protein